MTQHFRTRVKRALPYLLTLGPFGVLMILGRPEAWLLTAWFVFAVQVSPVSECLVSVHGLLPEFARDLLLYAAMLGLALSPLFFAYVFGLILPRGGQDSRRFSLIEGSSPSVGPKLDDNR